MCRTTPCSPAGLPTPSTTERIPSSIVCSLATSVQVPPGPPVPSASSRIRLSASGSPFAPPRVPPAVRLVPRRRRACLQKLRVYLVCFRPRPCVALVVTLFVGTGRCGDFTCTVGIVADRIVGFGFALCTATGYSSDIVFGSGFGWGLRPLRCTSWLTAAASGWLEAGGTAMRAAARGPRTPAGVGWGSLPASKPLTETFRVRP